MLHEVSFVSRAVYLEEDKIINTTKMSFTPEEYIEIKELFSLNLSRCGIHHNSHLACFAWGDCFSMGLNSYEGFKNIFLLAILKYDIQLSSCLKSLILNCYIMAVNGLEVPKGTVTEYLKTKEMKIETLYNIKES